MNAGTVFSPGPGLGLVGLDDLYVLGELVGLGDLRDWGSDAGLHSTNPGVLSVSSPGLPCLARRSSKQQIMICNQM